MEPLIINNWETGIAPSPHKGFGIMKNVDIKAFPGAVRTQKKPITYFHASVSGTFTADAGTDILTASNMAQSTANTTGTAVTVSSTGTLPAGLSASTNYFVIRVDQNSGTFKLATTITNADAGTAINITDAGTGTHTVTTVNPGTPRHFVEDPRTFTVFMQDSNARVWYNTGSKFRLLNGNTITNGVGNGLAIFRVSDGTATYLFAFRSGSIDVVNVYGSTQLGAPSWSNSWQSMNSGAGSGNSHHAIVAQDNIIYFCDDRYVGSIRENAGSVFDPASGATYTYSNSSLDLPLGATTYWLEELNKELLITVSNQGKIYPWDRTSDSFNIPIPIPEVGNKMKNINNIVYVLAGSYGNIYKTQGSYVEKFATIPEYVSNNAGTVSENPITWGGIGSANGDLLVGVATTTSGNSGAYRITPEGIITMDNMPSTGSGSVTAFHETSDIYYMGYASGVDYTDYTRYSSYETVIHSPLYRVANKTKRAKFSSIEITIAKPVAGHVRVKYRSDITSSFTDFSAAVAFTTDTSNATYEQDIGLTDVENIQVQIEMDGNVELLDVHLIP